MQQEWRKVTEGVHSPAPQLEDHNRDLDRGFKEDLDIFVEREDGVFYQMCYDGMEVPIIADYPGLLPASHVSNLKDTFFERVSLLCLTHHTISCSKGEALNATTCTTSVSEESGARAEHIFEEEGK